MVKGKIMKINLKLSELKNYIDDDEIGRQALIKLQSQGIKVLDASIIIQSFRECLKDNIGSTIIKHKKVG